MYTLFLPKLQQTYNKRVMSALSDANHNDIDVMIEHCQLEGDVNVFVTRIFKRPCNDATYLL